MINLNLNFITNSKNKIYFYLFSKKVRVIYEYEKLKSYKSYKDIRYDCT